MKHNILTSRLNKKTIGIIMVSLGLLLPLVLYYLQKITPIHPDIKWIGIIFSLTGIYALYGFYRDEQPGKLKYMLIALFVQLSLVSLYLIFTRLL